MGQLDTHLAVYSLPQHPANLLVAALYLGTPWPRVAAP